MKVNSESIITFFPQVDEVTFSLFIISSDFISIFFCKLDICKKIIFIKGKAARKPLLLHLVLLNVNTKVLVLLSFHVCKIKLTFESVKTGKNNDILKVMKYFGILEILMRVEKSDVGR